jgi:glutamyl-tRNA reductase
MNATIFVVGLSFRTAPVELREQLAAKDEQEACFPGRARLLPELQEAVLVSTCNRVEIFGVSTRPIAAEDLFRRLVPGPESCAEALYSYEDQVAIRHLFAVTSGLDSMVLGETEITGQVKQAYERARTEGLTGPVLNRLFQRAFQAAKQVRSRTRVGCGATSVASVAVEAAGKIFGPELGRRTVLIIGAGQMGEACLRHLIKHGAQSVLVCNRSLERAQALAAEIGGSAVPFAELFNALAQADVVISSTGSPEAILHRPDLETVIAQKPGRPLFLVDIAVPRDIDPGVQQLPGVYLYNIDDLQSLVHQHVQDREAERGRALEIIDEHTTAFQKQLAASTRTSAPRPQSIPRPFWIEVPVPATSYSSQPL